MKKGFISLVLIAVIALGAVTAVAHISNIFSFGGGQLSQGSWELLGGDMAINNGAIYSPAVGSIAKAVHPVSTEAGGSFTFTYSFTINDMSSEVLAGVADSDHETMVGYGGRGYFGVTNSGSMAGTPVASTTYTATISSEDGKSFTIRILHGGAVVASKTASGYVPTYVVLRIMNASSTNGPVITSVSFESTAPTVTPIATPEPPAPTPEVGNGSTEIPAPDDTPTVTPSPTPGSTYDPEIMDWYAAYYDPPVLSNQSYIYDDNGKLVKIVTGKPGSEVVAAAEPLNMTAPAVGNVTARADNVSANVTKNSTMPTVMPETTVPAATTKTQSPGFEAILAAISMVAALFYFGRKK